jgi:ABC-type multidrug transport system fused ATPase/permease subunit
MLHWLCCCFAGATEQEVHDAARSANAHNFISALPAGYQTQVSPLSALHDMQLAAAAAAAADGVLRLKA